MNLAIEQKLTGRAKEFNISRNLLWFTLRSICMAQHITDSETRMMAAETQTRIDLINHWIKKLKNRAIGLLNSADPEIKQDGLAQLSYLQDPEKYDHIYALLAIISKEERLLQLHVEACTKAIMDLQTFMSKFDCKHLIEGAHQHFAKEIEDFKTVDFAIENGFTDKDIQNIIS